MAYLVRNFLPNDHSAVFDESPHDTEEAAHQEYTFRCEAIREVGGCCELLNPQGERMASIMRPLGGGK
jgi:hypothetical protein